MTITAALAAFVGVYLMLRAKDLSPKHNESMYELGYLLIGRPAIFLICIVNFVYCLGLLMMYFIIFGDTMAELIS